MAIILGIDPGSRVTGYGIVESVGTQQRYVDSGCIRTRNHEALPAKLEDIFTGISQIIHEYSPDEVAVEKIASSEECVGGILALGVAPVRGRGRFRRF